MGARHPQGVPARGTQDWTFLNAEAFAGQPWWRVLHYGSTVLAWFTEPQALIVRLLELGCLALLAAAWITSRSRRPA